MAVLSIQVPDLCAEAVAALDGKLVADSCVIDPLVTLAIYHIGEELITISERWDDGPELSARNLRSIATQINEIADLVDTALP